MLCQAFLRLFPLILIRVSIISHIQIRKERLKWSVVTDRGGGWPKVCLSLEPGLRTAQLTACRAGEPSHHSVSTTRRTWVVEQSEARQFKFACQLCCIMSLGKLQDPLSQADDLLIIYYVWSFPGGSVGKESTCNVGDRGSIPGSRISPREGNGNPLWYSCLENSMDRGTWRATDNGVTKSWAWWSD